MADSDPDYTAYLPADAMLRQEAAAPEKYHDTQGKEFIHVTLRHLILLHPRLHYNT